MWVFCCGMNRSGSTLQYQLTVALVEYTGMGRGLGFVTPCQFNTIYHDTESSDGLLVVKCHEYFETARILLVNEKAKALCIHRDIRDVAVSYMKFREVSFWPMLARGILEDTLRNNRLWRSTENCFVTRYEDMQADLAGEVKRIASFLNVSISDHGATRIAAEHSLERNKQRLGKETAQQVVPAVSSAGYNVKTLMFPNHISSGAIGQWKHALSNFQIAVMEYVAEEWMQASGYQFSQPTNLRYRAGLLTFPFRKTAGLIVPHIQRLVKLRQRFGALGQETI